VPAKGKHLSTDLLRWAKHYGVAFALNPHFPINTIGLMRGALAALDLDVFPAYHQAIFHAMWGVPTNLGDETVVRQVLEKAGIDAERLLELAQQQKIKDRLRQSTEEAATRGAFGAPTFFVGEEQFFGNDRMEFVEAALRRGA
jgi:2-hydroxychromene-2-carboxylate isomerase